MSFERFTKRRLTYIPGNVKLWESPGKAGGLPVIIKKIIEKERPETINHHAAQISVPASVEDPSFDVDVNIRGLITMLQA